MKQILLALVMVLSLAVPVHAQFIQSLDCDALLNDNTLESKTEFTDEETSESVNTQYLKLE